MPCVPAAGTEARFCGVPMLFPVVPWLRAFDVFGPGDTPVPLIVLPFESVEPAVPLAPVDPAELWAKAWENAAIQRASVNSAIFTILFLRRMREPSSKDRWHTAHPGLPPV